MDYKWGDIKGARRKLYFYKQTPQEALDYWLLLNPQGRKREEQLRKIIEDIRRNE